MNRHLFLISNPGNPNDKNYVKAAKGAIDRWEAFFRSPIGGYWQDGEITRFGEQKPILSDSFRRMMIALNTVQFDYSIIVFCGHGGCTIDNVDAIQLPIPTPENHNLLKVDDLLGGGNTLVRRTIILDACRSLIPLSSEQLFEVKQFSEVFKLDGEDCANYYNSLVMGANPHVEVLYSTSGHHKAFATLIGSEYADAMSQFVNSNSVRWKSLAIQDEYGHYDLSMYDFQVAMKEELATGNKQVPDYKSIGDSSRSFPLVALHLPTTRSLYNSGAIIRIIED